MKQKLPAFPIKFQTKTGEAFTAKFKDIGDPKSIKLIVQSRSTLVASFTAPTPSEEVLSWGGFAKTAYEKHLDKEASDVTESIKSTYTKQVRLFAPEPVPEIPRHSKPRDSSPVLSTVPSPETIIRAKDASPNELYTSVSSKRMCRFEGPASGPNGFFILQVYDPDAKEWAPFEVPPLYRLTLFKGGESMPSATVKKVVPKSAPTPKAPAVPKPALNSTEAKSPSGLSVYEAWGQAFTKFGKSTDAPKSIVAFMEKQFPGRKTKWAKWVNNVRSVYNRGALPNTPAPKEKIAPYK